MWPLAAIADLAHQHGAQLFVDAAQLAPHREIDMEAIGIDHLALSGHKLYAPFGTGALVSAGSRSPATRCSRAAARSSSSRSTTCVWIDGPERYEAGSPNVIGAVALAAACENLDMERVEAKEWALAARLHAGPGLDRRPRHARAVARLSGPRRRGHVHAEGLARHATSRRRSATSSRSACATAASARTRCSPACSTSQTQEAKRLHDELKAGREPELPGAVRASIGLGTTVQDVDVLVAALSACQTR